MNRLPRWFFPVLILVIIALAFIGKLDAYFLSRRQQRIDQITIEQTTKAEKHSVHKQHRPLSLDLCPQEGSKMAKWTGCVTVKRTPKEIEKKEE